MFYSFYGFLLLLSGDYPEPWIGIVPPVEVKKPKKEKTADIR